MLFEPRLDNGKQPLLATKSRGCSAVLYGTYLPQQQAVISRGCMGMSKGFCYVNIQKAKILYKIMYSILFLASEFILNCKFALLIPLTLNLEYK